MKSSIVNAKVLLRREILQGADLQVANVIRYLPRKVVIAQVSAANITEPDFKMLLYQDLKEAAKFWRELMSDGVWLAAYKIWKDVQFPMPAGSGPESLFSRTLL